MRNRGPSPFAVGAAVIVAALVITYLGFRKDVPFLNSPYTIRMAVRDTNGINSRSPVRIAGVEVGRVENIEHTRPGAQSATLTLAITDKGRPVYDDATAKIRPRIFLEGNFFVDLSPGTPAAGEMADGDTIPVSRTASPVQFAQVLGALKSDTRNDLRHVFREVGKAKDAGGAKAFNDSLKYQPASFKFTAIVTEALLGERPGDLGDFVRDAGTVANALERNPGRLRSLVVDFNATAGALADRQSALSAAVGELPSTLRAASPALDALNAAFPDVRRFAQGARPGVRSLGPTVDATLPLVKQLRGLVGERELRGLSRNLRSATPALAQLAKTGISVLGQLRSVASCTSNVLVPTGNDQIQDKAFPTHGPVYQDLGKFLPGLAGESRSFDANGQFFKVLGTGGAETLNLGNGLFGSTLDPIVGNNPPPVRNRPPLRPDVPCETQDPPDLRSIPKGPPTAVATSGAATTRREARVQDVAVTLMRRQLQAQGKDTKVLDRPITVSEIRRIAATNGLTKQLDKVLARGGR
ncbi:MAG: phospholipid/cholesterol/gamma-HCH transport system substrate-binding protein [Solirubrobacteraceae bacterium]|jgi:virulence factor Mce-like protein|nr:phospholipid/cholesterol/gamma-HCH transport system substrate-binding protein [Solirubrobacteraceae bacterium]